MTEIERLRHYANVLKTSIELVDAIEAVSGSNFPDIDNDIDENEYDYKSPYHNPAHQLWQEGESNEQHLKLVDFLEDRLPLYMLPRDYIILEGMPKTPGGKIDRNNLRQIKVVKPCVTEITTPRNFEERYLTEVWIELFSLDNVSITDSFYDLGGHSLLAMRLASRISNDLGISMRINHVFEYPTIEKQAIWLGSVFEEG